MEINNNYKYKKIDDVKAEGINCLEHYINKEKLWEDNGHRICYELLFTLL